MSSGPALTPRAWQQRALAAMEGWTEGAFLVAAAPGAGKTVPALLFARRELAAGRARRVVVLCPTAPLTRQWARAAARVGVHLLPDAPEVRPPRDFQGIAVTYARVASTAATYARGCSPGTLVIADEAHHLGDELAWGEGFRTAFAGARRTLLLSGTPFRSDQTPIPGVTYDADGVATPDVSYTYGDAVRDGVCRRVAFVPYDGRLQWRSGDDVFDTTFDEVLTGREAGRRYRTAISTELPDGLPRILREAHARLSALRAGEHPDAGGLVVTADGTHARAVARCLHEVTGTLPTVVLHTDPRAAERLDAFRRGGEPWIVAVNMVSEGVDIPRLRVGVYATVAKTPLVFRQIVGRFVRVVPGRPREVSWVYLPADGHLRRLAADVETELRHVLRRDDDDGLGEEGLLDDDALERANRRESEPAADFTALSAEVAPQLALFAQADAPAGAAPPAPAPVAPPAPAPTPRAPEPEPEDPEPSAFERRATLRAERHQLVASLRRLDGRSHAEINAWLNRECRIASVQKASIAELQRSIDLLTKELERVTAKRRSRALARR